LNPNLVIGVGGCVASQEGAAIVARAPYVDLVFGPQTLHRLPQMIAARRESGKAQVDISFPEIEKFDALPPATVSGTSAFVSDHGGLFQVLQLLRRALHARRRDLAPASTDVLGGNRRAGGAGRGRGDAARPERERLARRDGRR
jgi:hypothetical protein